MRKYILPVILIFFIGGIIGVYLVNKPHTSLQNKKAAFSVSASDLIDEYARDESLADQKYLDQLVEVSGTVASVQLEGEFINVTLESSSELSSVICQMEKEKYSMEDFATGEAVSIKGKCTGMLMDVVLVQCVINQ